VHQVLGWLVHATCVCVMEMLMHVYPHASWRIIDFKLEMCLSLIRALKLVVFLVRHLSVMGLKSHVVAWGRHMDHDRNKVRCNHNTDIDHAFWR